MYNQYFISLKYYFVNIIVIDIDFYNTCVRFLVIDELSLLRFALETLRCKADVCTFVVQAHFPDLI